MDKIKEDIIRLIDGELSADESSRVMNEINQSPELESFYKAAQKSTSSLKSYFGSEEVQEANVRLGEFIDSKARAKSEEKTLDRKRPLIDNKVRILEKLSKIFSLGSPVPLYSAAAILMLSLGFNLYLFTDKAEYSSGLTDKAEYSSGLVGFSSEVIEINEPKFRGIDDTYNKAFTKVLVSMHEEKKLISRLTYGSEVFLIKLEELIYDGVMDGCYRGSIQSLDTNDNFAFCFNQNEETTFIIFPDSD